MREWQGKLPRAALRWWSLLLCAVTLALSSPAAWAQAFQTIAPLSFTKVFAGADPLPQVITVASTGANFNYSAAVVNSTGGNWLSLTGNYGCCYATPQALTVNANPGVTLGAGTYTAEVDLSSQNGKVTAVIPVSLTIASPGASSFDAIAGSLTFSMLTAGSTPPVRSLEIHNAGGGTLHWSASATTADGGKWLNVSTGSGDAPFALNVGINPANLPSAGLVAGTFVGQVALDSSGGAVTVPVTVTVGSSVFQQINPLSFTKTLEGGDPDSQVITVASTGATFNYFASVVNSTGGDWLSLTGNYGCCYSTPQALTVNVNPAITLAAGTYTAEIILKSQSGGEAVVVPVSLIIEPPSATYFDALPGALSFSLVTKGSAPPTQPISIRNAGVGTLNWTAASSTADGGDWIKLSASTGAAPSTLEVSIEPSQLPGEGLVAGTFTGQVVLQAGNDTVTVPVAVTVGDSVFQQINALSFTKTFEGGDPASQVITVASTGANFNYYATVVNSTGGSWLTLTGNYGCCYSTPQALTVNANPAITLATGTYTAEIILESQSGSESVTVPVSLTIAPPSATYFDSLPGELSFSFATKGNAPPTQPIPIRNAGAGTLSWTAASSTADGAGWITLSASSGTAPSTLNVGINPSDLPGAGLVAGTFTGQVVLQTGEDTVTVPITVTVGDSVFQQINALSFTKAYAGADPLSQVITVASTGAAFNYFAAVVNSTGGNWLTLTGNYGCCYSTSQALTVNANPVITLAVGTYTAEIILKSQSGGESVVVPVSLVVKSTSNAFFDSEPGALTFSMLPGGGTPAALPLPIRNAGASTLTWSGATSTADGGDWLALSPSAGAAPSTSSVSVDPAELPGQGLIPGTFIGQVSLQAGTDVVTIPVTYSVGTSVFKQLAPLTFSKTFQGANPASQVISVGSTGTNFNYYGSIVNGTGGNWLTLTGNYGCCYSTPQLLTVGVNPDINLANGTYSAEIIFKSQSGAEPMVVPVTLNVGSTIQAAATPTFSPAGGTYASAQNVTITTATTDAAIYYTTDGSQPTIKSASYTGPVKVTASGTLNAIAVASGYTQSGVGSATYTITGGQCVVIDNSSGFTSGGLSLNGGASISGKLLQLTDGGFDEARSAFSSTRVPIDSFITDFTFQLLDAYAEGFTFTIQGDSPRAVGASGGGLGYQGIPYSAAVKIDLFDTAGEGYDSTGIYLNGAAPTVPSIDLGPSGIDVHNGHIFAAHIAYVNGVYQGSITDTVTGASASLALQGYVTNPGEMAFVGFTGGTSSEGSATQNILTWKYQGGSACGH